MPARPFPAVEDTVAPGSTVLPGESGTTRVGAHAERASLSPPDLALPGRYVDLGPIAGGAFGDVRRVRDTELGRVLAMKLLHPEIASRPWIRRRFLAEVQITAQLQHPGIVPVYDHGELPDGRLWYVMKEVRGRTLGAIFDELFASASPEGFAATPSGWTFRRAADVFVRLAQTVAYAHSRGVVHRDLKPENVMVGEHGEVMVMDWGLSRRDPRADEEDSGEPSGEAPGEEASAALTRHGDVLGTPAYMPPEQALGARDLHGPGSDVYALGAILYHALTGRPPYQGGGITVVREILAGPPPSIEEAARGGPPVPPALTRAAERAMRREIAERCSAEDLANDVVAWLDGARRREEALVVLERARALEPTIAGLRARAEELRSRARALLDGVRPFDPVELKEPAWALEEEASRLEVSTALHEAEWLEAVQGALTVDPELAEAHAALADHHREALLAAERAHREADVARAEALLKAHDRGRHAALLRGEGALTVVTDPPGAVVRLSKYVLRRRRLVPEDIGVLGVTPLHAVTLQKGSYLLRIEAPGRHEVRYPVLIERGGHWDGVAPGDREPHPIALPNEGELGPEDCHVPAGWCWTGGDPNAPDSLPGRRIWVDGFVVRRFPVTNEEYIQFLNDLVETGREEEALSACPRSQLGMADAGGDRLFFARDGSGRFVARDDELGQPILLDSPVVLVDWHGAVSFARWLSARSGLPFRLLDELEREKAARGVDGRLFPWGDHAEATMAGTVESYEGQPRRVSVYDYPLDESPYGVRGLSGNSRDWCGNVWRLEGPRVAGGRLEVVQAEEGDPEFRAVRGGAWASALNYSRSATRLGNRPGLRRTTIGLRVVRPWYWPSSATD